MKQMVERMGGRIKVESKVNEGTKYTILLPFKIDPDPVIRKKTEEPVSLKGVKALLVEDNNLNMEISKFYLEQEEVEVYTATNGQEAVDMFMKSKIGFYDIILMDIMMPKMDGHQAAKAIRAMYADRPDAEEIPIIALSANAFSEDVQASLDAGMNGHVSKPLNMEEVTKVIERNLNRP